MAFLTLSKLRKDFENHQAVKDFSLSVEKGEFITFLGPSGCGKTTILRMLAGFETPTSGTVSMGGKDITHTRTSQRNVGMVFQSYALFPNMTVAENIGFGLRIAKIPRPQVDARVQEMLSLINLETLAERYPWQMSGGQQQRVALARALSNHPQILLLDEPLSALDAKIRVTLREEIRELQRTLQITTVFVTHDQEEALAISDRIVVLRDGQAEQIGTPQAIYNTPRTRFVASFIGTLNQLPAVVVDPTRGQLQSGGHLLASAHDLNDFAAGSSVTLAIRPEALRWDEPQSHHNTVDAVVEDVSFLGSIVRVRCRWGDSPVFMDLFNDSGRPLPHCGQSVRLTFSPQSVLVLHDS